jgi:hypothetical protein
MRPSDEWLDEIQRRIQESLNESKWDILRDRYGMVAGHRSADMPVEMESEWLDYVLEFERQFETAKSITVRERIGDPPIIPINDIPIEDMQAAIDAFLDLLDARGIAVDFLGDVDVVEVYQYLTGTLLDEEVDDMQIPGMCMVFTYATSEYNAEMWTEEFVSSILRRDEYVVHTGSIPIQFYNPAGIPVAATEFHEAIKEVWSVLPHVTAHSVEMLEVQVTGNEARTEVIIKWTSEGDTSEHQVTSTFLLHPSPYLDDGWEVVQTSFLEDLKNHLNAIE